MKTIFTFLFSVSSFLFSYSQPFNVEKIKADIRYLSGDKLKGRATSSKQEAIAATYITEKFKQFGLLPKGKDNGFLYPFTFMKPDNGHDSTKGEQRSGLNVAGYLDNQAENTIVIGAHFDHLGLGEDGNTLDPAAKGEVHNGADDNASGTAGVIALADYFTKNNRKEKFNFLFICFSGEELGLIGSKKFCEQPSIDFSHVNYMINMDMIGRLNDSTKKLIIYGVGTAKEWLPLINDQFSDFNIKKDSAGIGPSDQTSFYLKNIPVLHFFTGQHMDYHKATDDYSKINVEGEKKILQYIAQLIEKTEDLPKFEFLKTRNPTMEMRNFKVTMGVMPDYAYEGKGMRIDAVIDGRPASKGGVKDGDIVIKMGDQVVANLNDYMKALSLFKKGQTIQLIVRRDKNELTLNITF
jgi:Zn-dependent M28 family amino/carboxypeptidase